MNEAEIRMHLEEIGLTEAESKVYLALLRLGESTSGAIAKESGTAISKIYIVLDKLVKKGMAASFEEDGVRHFRATNPAQILRYLKEKRKMIKEQEKRIAKMLPALMRLEGKSAKINEAMVFEGASGVKSAFGDIVDTLEKGDAVDIMGVYDFGKKFLRYAKRFHQERSKKGINARFLINADASAIAEEFSKYPPAEIRFMPKDMFTPAIFLIYADKVIINLGEELVMFLIKSKKAADSFRAYFSLMWKRAKVFRTLHKAHHAGSY